MISTPGKGSPPTVRASQAAKQRPCTQITAPNVSDAIWQLDTTGMPLPAARLISAYLAAIMDLEKSTARLSRRHEPGERYPPAGGPFHNLAGTRRDTKARKDSRVGPLDLAYKVDGAEQAILEANRLIFLYAVEGHCWWVVSHLYSTVRPEYEWRYSTERQNIHDACPDNFHAMLIESWKTSKSHGVSEPLRESIRNWVRTHNLREVTGSGWNVWLVRQALIVCHGWMLENSRLMATGDMPRFDCHRWSHHLRQLTPLIKPPPFSFNLPQWNGEPLHVYCQKIDRLLGSQRRIAIDSARAQISQTLPVKPILRPQRLIALALHLCLHPRYTEAAAKNLVKLDEIRYDGSSARLLQDDLREAKAILGLRGWRGKPNSGRGTSKPVR
jgi:hypothetical protein